MYCWLILLCFSSVMCHIRFRSPSVLQKLICIMLCGTCIPFGSMYIKCTIYCMSSNYKPILTSKLDRYGHGMWFSLQYWPNFAPVYKMCQKQGDGAELCKWCNLCEHRSLRAISRVIWQILGFVGMEMSKFSPAIQFFFEISQRSGKRFIPAWQETANFGSRVTSFTRHN